MNIETLALGLYGTNCYIAHEDGIAAVIDPGSNAAQILEQMEKLQVQVAAILLTHGHFDHVSAVRPIVEATGCKVYLNEKDLALPHSLTNGPLYATDYYADGDTICVGSMQFEVLHTPGHTPGSVCLRSGDVLFVGDTLFCGSCGRTDLEGGSPEQMYQSLKRLYHMEGNYRVLPGHSSASTLDQERKYNPYMAEALRK